MNPGDSQVAISRDATLRTSIEPFLQNQVHVDLQNSGQQFMCQTFVQSHWNMDGTLLADDCLVKGKYLYGKEMQDQHECLPVNNKEASETSTILFEKEKSVLHTSHHVEVPDISTSTLQYKYVDLERIQMEPSKFAQHGRNRYHYETMVPNSTMISNSTRPVVKLNRIKFNTLNRNRLNSELNFILKPKRQRKRYIIISLDKSIEKPINSRESKQLVPIKKCSVNIKRTETSKQISLQGNPFYLQKSELLAQMKKCRVNVKRLKIPKTFAIETNEQEEGTDLRKRGVQFEDKEVDVSVQFKDKTVDVSVQFQTNQCNAMTQTNNPVVEKTFCDFSCQTFIPDVTTNGAEQVIRDLKQEIKLRQGQHQADILALRRLINVKNFQKNTLTGLLTDSQENKTYLQIAENSVILTPRQPQNTASMSSCIRIAPKIFNFEYYQNQSMSGCNLQETMEPSTSTQSNFSVTSSNKTETDSIHQQYSFEKLDSQQYKQLHQQQPGQLTSNAMCDSNIHVDLGLDIESLLQQLCEIMNPGDSQVAISRDVTLRTSIEPFLQNQVHVDLQNSGQQFMCQTFVQSHWNMDGTLLADDGLVKGKYLYGKEMQDQHECLPVNNEEASETSTILFEKEKSVLHTSHHVEVPDISASTLQYKNVDLERIQMEPSKFAQHGRNRYHYETMVPNSTMISNSMRPIVKLNRIKFNTLNRNRLNSELNFILKPKRQRKRYIIISLDKSIEKPINSRESKQLVPIKKCSVNIKRTETSKQISLQGNPFYLQKSELLAQMKKCRVNVKRLKIPKTFAIETNEQEEGTDLRKRGVQFEYKEVDVSVQFKDKTVDVSVQFQTNQCDAMTQTNNPVVEKTFCDFSCQTFIPDVTTNGAEQVIRDLKQEIKLRQGQHQADILALRRLINVKNFQKNTLTGLLTDSQENKTYLQIAENSVILTPRQPQNTASMSSCIRIAPKIFNFEYYQNQSMSGCNLQETMEPSTSTQSNFSVTSSNKTETDSIHQQYSFEKLDSQQYKQLHQQQPGQLTSNAMCDSNIHVDLGLDIESLLQQLCE